MQFSVFDFAMRVPLQEQIDLWREEQDELYGEEGGAEEGGAPPAQ